MKDKKSGNLGKVIGNNAYEYKKHLKDPTYKGKYMSWDIGRVFGNKPTASNSEAQPKHSK